MASNEHHEWIKRRDWPAVEDAILKHIDQNLDLLMDCYEEVDEHGRLPHHWLAVGYWRTEMIGLIKS